MDIERQLLFGVIALQRSLVEADRLAKTCAEWAADPRMLLPDLMVERAVVTAEQKAEVEAAVVQELATHGGDARATLASVIDGCSLAAIGEAASLCTGLKAASDPLPAQGGHALVGTLRKSSAECHGRYTLSYLHARGAMGRVWLARDDALGREVALKELRPDQADNTVVCSRFLHEARVTAQLEHPGIVPVYELGEGQTPYYTMRFVRGCTLTEAVRSYHKHRAAGSAGSVGLLELLTAFVGVCHAVAYAHSRGVIHRDLKGQNVVLGDFGEVVLLDWGLAKRVGTGEICKDGHGPVDAAREAYLRSSLDPAVETGAGRGDKSSSRPSGPADASSAVAPDFEGGDSPRVHSRDEQRAPAGSKSGCSSRPESGAGLDGTVQGRLLGTPAYMAPEQARGRHDQVDARTDIYGLGAILYEILTGRPPFVGTKTSDVVSKVCAEAPAPPRQVVGEVAPGLEAICLKALSKAQDKRYATATELAQEVRRWLADEPVHAYAEPWSGRALRWAHRHKTTVSAAAGLLAAATITMAVSTVLVLRERNEAKAQGQQARQAVGLLTKVADSGFDEQLDPLQKEFLENALAYYEQFTNRSSREAEVKLEHGRAYQQMGDIERKLGRLADAERSYRGAVRLLEPMAGAAGAATEPKRELARARALLADLLVRRGADTGQAEALYQQAALTQRALARPQNGPPAAEDLLRMGQTEKGRAELLRLSGRFSQARPVYDQALTALESAHAVAPLDAEIRNELALACDARGWILRELGDADGAQRDYGRALALLDALVTEFPTVPRHREALAKVCNSLALLDQDAGRFAGAMAHLRREIPLVERLAQDFPDRPEYRRGLARALTNLGNVLSSQNRGPEAEPVLRRAIELNEAIMGKSPDDVLVRFQLAMSYHDLGEALIKQGNPAAAVAEYRKAQTINERLVKEFPDKPRYRCDLAGNLDSLALALAALSQPEVDKTFRAASEIYEKLVAAHPENVDYRIRQATCLRNRGAMLSDLGRPEAAEPIYRQALALLDTTDPRLRTADWLRKQAELLSNVGVLHRAGAEDALRHSIEISEGLMAGKAGTANDRHNLAIAQNNLGELLSADPKPAPAVAVAVAVAAAPHDARAWQTSSSHQLYEARSYYARSIANFEKLVADAPGSVELQSHFGLVLAGQGKCLDRGGQPGDAKRALAAAVEHQRKAVQLSKNAPVCRLALADHMIDLARINVQLGAFDEAARLAIDVPRNVPLASRAQACYSAARVLARLVDQVDRALTLSQVERERLTRNYLARAVVLLRDAIDSGPKLAEQIKADPDIKSLESRPQFQSIMNSLVDVDH
jgi:serine/threonine-protein kinase